MDAVAHGTTATVTDRTVHALDRSGLVRDWLVGPVWATPCDDLDDVLEADGSPWGPEGRWVLTNGPDVAPLKRRLYERRPLVVDQTLPEVVEGGELTWRAPGGSRVDTGLWTRARTGMDGLVDWSQFCYTPEYRHALAATVLEVDQAEVRTLEVSSTGPFALWVGADLVLVSGDVSYMEPLRHKVSVRLPSGTTQVVLATWQVAFRECRHVASLRVVGQPVRVVLPSPGADETAATLAEQVLERVAVRSWAVLDDSVTIIGPQGAALTVEAPGGARVPVRLVGGEATVSLSRLTHAHGLSGGEATASMLSTGETSLTVRVDDDRCPVARTLDVAVVPPRSRLQPEGTDPSVWRDELLQHVADQHPGTARALARARLVDAELGSTDLDPSLAMIESRSDCADFEAVGLMHLWHRIAEDRWETGQRERVQSALLGFKYWIDQPGLDAMCYFTENHQFVWHTAEMLVGEAFSDSVFRNTGWTGAEHARHGRDLAVEWMSRKLRGGFSEFDSNAYLAIDSLALVSLVELALDEQIRRMAEALLDKLLLTLAANSWRGVHGAAHGRSYTPTLRSSRLEETAPIMWALWGTGSLNAAVLPATALALARTYQLPPLVRAVATQEPEHWWGRQVYRGGYRLHHDLLSRPYGSDLRVWRTPDAMLSSVQDYRAALPGLQEHVWGATLGTEVQVFATLPAADTSSPSARPNAWAGQRVLPRVRQHRDSLIALHGLGGDEVARTHLWFPAAGMDETRTCGSWLAGRRGDGYVAVSTPGGVRPTTSGSEAWQAWSPLGDGRSYVVTVGRAADDGTFDDFVSSLTEPELSVDDAGGPAVRWRARDGRTLEISWSGVFLVADEVVGLDGDGRPEVPPHLENPAVRLPAGSSTLDASWAGEKLLLDLESGRRLAPSSGLDRQEDDRGR